MINFKSSAGEFYTGIQTYGNFPIKNWYLSKFGKIPNSFTIGNYVRSENFIKENSKYLIHETKYYSFKIKQDVINVSVYDFKSFAVVLSDNHLSKELIQQAQFSIYYHTENKKINDVKSYIINNRVEDEKQGVINLVCQNQSGLFLKEYTIKNVPIDFDANYNEDFKEIDKIIIQRLNTENDKGLVLLYGEPGTGKTNYIRRIINNVDKKRILYMPPDMATQLANPALVPFLAEVPNSILIIEDAENVLLKRQGQHNQAISNILNLSDGLFGDCLNIQIVATFNTDLRNIDEALLRKGRLIAKHKFGNLTEDRVKKLCSNLGIKFKKEFKTLADIYNSQEKTFAGDVVPIGFKAEKESLVTKK